VPRHGLRDRLTFVAEAAAIDPEIGERYGELRVGAFDAAPVAIVVVDRAGFVTGANQLARTLFQLGAADIGRPFQDLELSYRPLDLRTALEEAYAENAEVSVGPAVWTASTGESRTLELTVRPLRGGSGSPLGASICIEDVTDIARIGEHYERSKRQVETAYEELQSTVEELESTNEELHSTNEELETTNEELQSSNEELETMNEELQSTNDELETMNEEQAKRSRDLDKVNMFLEGILGSLGIGVVVLNREQRVQVWNGSATDLWGLRPEEVEGQHFLGLDIGLPVERLKEPIRNAMSDGAEGSEEVIESITRRGKKIDCKVRTLPLRTHDGDVYGALILMSQRGDSLD
jgi:two-component system, chemotaxis family, CheB/CheR fusion protein